MTPFLLLPGSAFYSTTYTSWCHGFSSPWPKAALCYWVPWVSSLQVAWSRITWTHSPIHLYPCIHLSFHSSVHLPIFQSIHLHLPTTSSIGLSSFFSAQPQLPCLPSSISGTRHTWRMLCGQGKGWTPQPSVGGGGRDAPNILTMKTKGSLHMVPEEARGSCLDLGLLSVAMGSTHRPCFRKTLQAP